LQLSLELSPEKLWISAQENLESKFIFDWSDRLAQRDFVSKASVGKSVLGNPIELIQIKQGAPKHSLVSIGRQHPPEVPGATIAMMSFVEVILADTEIAKSFREKFEVLVFPLLNPDGVDAGNCAIMLMG